MGTARVERVVFSSGGDGLAGDLHLPGDTLEKHPGAVVVAGSLTCVKEQMAGRYAAGLAARGITALAFDFRDFGQSGGSPRGYESPARKIDDIRNAITFLGDLPLGRAGRIGVLGVCTGAGHVAASAAKDERVRSVAMVAPWLHDPEFVRLVYGGERGVRWRLIAGWSARDKYDLTGVVDYGPAVSTTDEFAPVRGMAEYYLDPVRGGIPQWDNRFAVMSWPPWLRFDPIAIAREVRVPTLLVHSEDGVLPDGARLFQEIAANVTELRWLPGQTCDFFDDSATVDTALAEVEAHFRSTL